MWGFSKKRFFVTLVLSMVVWLVSVVIQGYLTFARYIGTFSTGCHATGYPIDVCIIQGPYIPAPLVIFVNILFWFWIVHLFGNWLDKGKSKT